MMIKICGITSIEDALRSVELGANALGFNFYPASPRCIAPDRAAEIIQKIPSDVLTVGVFVGVPQAPLPSLQALQIHGLESAHALADQTRRIIVATSPEKVERFPGYEILIDVSWGTGRTIEWSRLAKLRRPFVLSGGLNALNVGEAIRTLKPAGVDVCSGVESAPGKKDWEQLQCFMDAVHAQPEKSSEFQRNAYDVTT